MMKVLSRILPALTLTFLMVGCPTVVTLSVSPSSIRLNLGQSTTVTAISSVSGDTFTWSSGDTSVATVTQDGRVTAVGVGTARIWVTSGVTNRVVSAAITVPGADEDPRQVTVFPSAVTIAIGDSIELTGVSTREEGGLVWSSGDEAVATVDASGLVTGVSAGTAIITAQGLGADEVDTASISVEEPLAQIATVRPAGVGLAVGETVALSATSLNPDDTFTWSTQDALIASVDGTGVVTAVAPGTVLVTAIGSVSGAVGNAVIAVEAPEFEQVTVSPNAAIVTVGDSVALTGVTTRIGDTLVWSSADPAVATVDQNGVITGVSPGTSTITAQGAGAGERSSAVITVVAPLTPVALVRPLAVSISVSETIALAAFSEDSSEAFDWLSVDETVATVDSAGVVTGTGPGDVSITVVGVNTGATGGAMISVTELVVHEVNVIPSTTTITVADTVALAASTTRAGDILTWSSANETVATVDENGLVTGIAAGTVIISAQSTHPDEGASADITVVEPPVTDVTVSPLATSVDIGEQVSLSATSTDVADSFSWTSSSPSAATVSDAGVVTGVAPGTTQITVTGTNSGAADVSTITVLAAVVYQVQVTPDTAQIFVGDTIPLLGSTSRVGGLLTWSSGDESVVTVDQNGLVTGIGAGTAVVAVRGTEAGEEALATITVAEVPVPTATVLPLGADISVDSTIALTATSTDATDSFLWSTEDGAIATVNAFGVVTGVAPGTVIISAEGSNSGALGSTTVTVTEVVVHSVFLLPASAAIFEGDTFQFAGETTRTDDVLSWSSDDEATATVDSSGLVTGIVAGTATITVQGTNPDERATASITVLAPVVHVATVSPLGASIEAESTITLTASSSDPSDTFTWSSADVSIATVDDAGVVTGVAEGLVSIVAIGTSSGAIGSSLITVTALQVDAVLVTVTPNTATITFAGEVALTAVSTDTEESFTWSSTNDLVATVSSSGVVTGVSAGTVSITATGSNSGAEDSVMVVVDGTAPTLVIGEPNATVTRTGPIEYMVTYAGADSIALSKADVLVNETGDATATVDDVAVTGDGERLITLSNVTGDGTLGISIVAGTASDVAGNQAAEAGPSTTVVVDNSAPGVFIGGPTAALTSAGPVEYTVTYDRADTITLSKASVLVNGTGTAAVTLADVTVTGDSERTITFSSVEGDGTLGISIVAGTASDVAGNQAAEAGPSATVLIDNTAPDLVVSGPSATLTRMGPIDYSVGFTGATLAALSAGDITLDSTGTATGNVAVTGSGIDDRTVTISAITGDGNLGISIAPGTASDALGNLAAGFGPSATFVADNTAPTLAIGPPSVTATGVGPVTYALTYAGADSVTLADADVTLNATGDATGTVALSGSGTTARTVTISDIAGDGTLAISVAADTAADTLGNSTAAVGPSTTFIVDSTIPRVVVGPPSATDTNTGPVAFTLTYTLADAVTLVPENVQLNSAGDAITGTVFLSVYDAVTGTVVVTIDDITGGTGPLGITIAEGTATSVGGTPAPASDPSDTVQVWGPAPTLVPGTGFTEATPQPATVGTPGAFGIDAKAIARWDVVPYQTFDGIFQIGVVAFHINGIDRVEFSVDDGPWVAAPPAMTLNERTGVVEYWVNLDASLSADGPIEVRAVAYPKVGIPRVFGSAMTAAESIDKGEHALFLNTNAGGTLPKIEMYVSNTGDDANDGSQGFPFLTIMRAARAIQDASPDPNADGGRILLAAGEYRIGTYSPSFLTFTENRWLTIEPMAGIAKEDVLITGTDSSGLRTRLVRLHLLTLAPVSGSTQNILNSNGPLEDYYWVDGCELLGPGRTENGAWSLSSLSGIYITDCQVSACRDAPSGKLVRNLSVADIGSDAFTDSKLVVNSTAVGIDPTGTPFHADVLQIFSNGPTVENIIAYNVLARSQSGQGFFAGDNIPIKDIAFIDCDVSNQEGEGTVAAVFQFGGPTEHLYVRECVFVGAAKWRIDFRFTAHNVVVKNSAFISNPLELPTPLEVEGISYIPPPTQ